MQIAIAAITIIIALGAALDTLLYKQEKVKFYNKMKQWIDIISNTKIPKIHLLLIDKALFISTKLFDWKNKPFRSIFNSIIISWLLTSIMFAYGDLIGGSYKNNKYWHDILPWYPTYIVNYIFDLATIVFTIFILKKIKGKNIFIAFFGITIDMVIAYSLAVFCLLSFGWSQQLTENADLVTSPAAHIPDFDKFLYEDEYLNFEKGLFQNRFGHSMTRKLESEGVKPNDLVVVSNEGGLLRLLKMSNQRVSRTIKYMYDDNRYPILMPIDFKYQIDGKERTQNVEMRISHDFQHPYAAMTTLIPTAFYTIILIFMYLSKEITVFGKWLMLRVFKSAMQQGSPEKIDGFKPGLHFGILLSVVVAVVEFILVVTNNK